MIEIQMNKEVDLSFKLNIEGAKSPPKVRLMIENSDINVVFPGTVVGDTATISIPELRKYENIFSTGNHRAYLEVLIEDNRFIPWEDSVSLSYPVAVKAAVEGVQSRNENTLSEKVKTSVSPVIEVVEKTEPVVSYPEEIEDESKKKFDDEEELDDPSPVPVEDPIVDERDEEEDEEDDYDDNYDHEDDDRDELKEEPLVPLPEVKQSILVKINKPRKLKPVAPERYYEEEEDEAPSEPVRETKALKRKEVSIDDFLNFDGNAKDFLEF